MILIGGDDIAAILDLSGREVVLTRTGHMLGHVLKGGIMSGFRPEGESQWTLLNDIGLYIVVARAWHLRILKRIFLKVHFLIVLP